MQVSTALCKADYLKSTFITQMLSSFYILLTLKIEQQPRLIDKKNTNNMNINRQLCFCTIMLIILLTTMLVISVYLIVVASHYTFFCLIEYIHISLTTANLAIHTLFLIIQSYTSLFITWGCTFFTLRLDLTRKTNKST